jgi:hypothetical protein
MKLRAIKKQDYPLLLSLDKAVYPTNNPVTPKILDNWYAKNTEFGMVYEENGKVLGFCILIPLNSQGWKKLINGDITEADLDTKTLFDNSRDKEIGLHVYHIEKLDKTIKEFYKITLADLNNILNKLKKENPSLKICGFSGLCVTSEGIGLFNKLNCKEKKFISPEHIMIKENKLKIASSKEEIIKLEKENYKIKNRCKMLVTLPKEDSLVWNFFK